MRIVQIIPSFGMGGAETMCAALSRQLLLDGHQVSAISLSGEKTVISQRLEASGVPVYYLDKALGSGLQCVGQLKKLLKTLQPQLIHTHLHALKYAALASSGVPIVHTIHNQAAREAVFLDKQIGKYCFRRGRALPVALTREIRQSVMDVYGLPEEKVSLVPNGIDLSACQEKEDYALHYPVEILHVGRFFPQKNHAAILGAAALLKKRGINARIHCYGDGPLLEQTRQAAQKQGLAGQVLFEGVTSDVFTPMSQADLFILPSSWEGMPMTVIEAMGTGLSVIASRVGGVPDMVTDGESGLLIEPTAEALAAAIEKLARNEALRQSLGKKAREEAQRFSLPAMARGYEALYASVTEGAPL